MSNTTAQPATFIWHPIDGTPVIVSLYRHPGAANQRRCVVDGKTVGYVWQRNVNGYRAVWSYRLESDTLGVMRGSCRDRDEALSRLMFEARDRGVRAGAGAGAGARAAAVEAAKCCVD